MLASNRLDGGIREVCVSEGGSGAAGRCRKNGVASLQDAQPNRDCRRRFLVAALLTASCVLFLGSMEADAHGGQQWFSAWTVSHGARLTTPILTGESVRMI